MPPLSRSSHVPLYVQLAAQLRGLIHSGELEVGSAIPSERELAQSYNVSRITARMAVDLLLRDGYVYRQQGRGTFVAQPTMRSVRGFTSFTEDMLSRGRHPSSRIIRQELIHVPEQLQTILKIGPADLVMHLGRVRLADGQPVAVQWSYIPYRLCPGLEKVDLAQHSLFDVLRSQFGITPTWTEAEVAARLATSEEAALLQLRTSDPVLAVRGLTFTASFQVVEYVSTVYRGESLSLYLGRQQLMLPEG